MDSDPGGRAPPFAVDPQAILRYQHCECVSGMIYGPMGQSSTISRLFSGTNRQKALSVTTLWTAIGLVLLIIAPRTAPVFVVGAIFAPVAWNLADTGALPSIRLGGWSIVMLVAGLFFALNASWSPHAPQAITTVLIYFVLFAALVIVFSSLATLSRDVLLALATGLVLGWSVATVIFSIEYFAGGAGHRLFKRSWTEWAAITNQNLDQDIAGYVFNRSVAFIGLLGWMVLAAVRLLPLPRPLRIVSFCALAIAIVTIFLSAHKTSKVATLLSILVFVFSYYSVTHIRRLIASVVLVSGLLIVPFVATLEKMGAYDLALLGPTLRHRIVIWGFTADEYVKESLAGRRHSCRSRDGSGDGT